MTKQASPSSDSKLPGKILYEQGGLGGAPNADSKSRQHVELLAYFNALSDFQRSDVLRNLHADKEGGEFLEAPSKSDQVDATQDEVAKAKLYDYIMKERRVQNLRLKYGSHSIPFHSLSSSLQITLSS
jgi:hypothetical protein